MVALPEIAAEDLVDSMRWAVPKVAIVPEMAVSVAAYR